MGPGNWSAEEIARWALERAAQERNETAAERLAALRAAIAKARGEK